MPNIKLLPGDAVPWFIARSAQNPQFHFHTTAGRYIVLCFFGSAGREPVARMLAAVRRREDVFQDAHASFFAISCDAADESQRRLEPRRPGFHVFWDFDFAISTLYGLCDPPTEEPGKRRQLLPATFVLDPNLRVLATIPITDWETHADRLSAFVAGLPALPKREPAPPSAPVLVVPRVFEPAFCRELIAAYEKVGGEDSGFMRDQDGRTVAIIDHSHKRRRDVVLDDEGLRAGIRARMQRRLSPEIRKAFQFHVTRIERFMVACYDAGEGGYFRPHRDDTTKGTAHRRFAVTLNLNAEDYEGGDLRFPEYDPRTYRAPTGGAVVFSCSLLHEATPITKGRRYCVLPFLYNEEAARLREANLEFLADEGLRDAVRSSIQPAPQRES